MTRRTIILSVFGVVFLLVSIYGLLGVIQAASLYIGVRALLNANLWGSVFLIGLAASISCFISVFHTNNFSPSGLSTVTGLLLTVFAAWFFFPVVPEFLAVDSCLDRGGSFDYVLSVCDFSRNHPSITILSRHGFRLTAFVILFLAGLKLIVPALSRRTT